MKLFKIYAENENEEIITIRKAFRNETECKMYCKGNNLEYLKVKEINLDMYELKKKVEDALDDSTLNVYEWEFITDIINKYL